MTNTLAVPAPRALDDRITALRPEVDAEVRHDCGEALALLRGAGSPGYAILKLSTLIEGDTGLLGRIAAAYRATLKSKLLFEQIDQLHEQGVLPPEIATNFHWTRIYANRARHRGLCLDLTVEDGEAALHLALRALEWFYCVSERGPRLPTLYAAPQPQLPAAPDLPPLTQVPRKPVGDPLRLPLDQFAEAYARLFPEHPRLVALLRRAAAMCWELDPQSTTVDPIDLGGANSPIRGLWLTVFTEACLHGRRMLAALLLAVRDDQFDDDVLKLRAGVLNLLCR